LCFPSKKTARWLWPLFFVAIVTQLGLRALTIKVSPAPSIDVYTNITLAIDYFLAGKNPYSQPYPDIYAGHGLAPPIFPYWPGLLYFVTPFRALFGDYRYAFLASDAI